MFLNCFGYGHPSRVCKKVCNNCSEAQPSPRRDRLGPSELDIHAVSQASSSPKGASRASPRGASQLPSLPDLGSTPPRSLKLDVPHSVVVHRSKDGEEMETQATGVKRLRAPSSSPPASPSQSIKVPTENRYQTLTSMEDTDKLDTPSTQGASKKVGKPLQRLPAKLKRHLIELY